MLSNETKDKVDPRAFMSSRKRDAPKLQEVIASRKNTLNTNWSDGSGLTPWQEYAAKTLHTKNEPLMLLIFHDSNVNYLVERARKKVNIATGVPAATPSQMQIVVTLLIIYDNLREESRMDLRGLLIRANRQAAGSIIKKMMTNSSMYSHYYHDKVTRPQPIPQPLAVNVNGGGSRSLSGGKPFVI